MITVEFVCTGNSGRSPAAEAVGKKHASDNGLDVRVISSGTHVDAAISYGCVHALRILAHVQDSPHLSRDAQEITKRLLNDPEAAARYERDAAFRNYVEDVTRSFTASLSIIERINKNWALASAGFSYVGEPTQTVARDDVDLVLPMTDELADTVRTIYVGKDVIPIIEPLPAYSSVAGRYSGTLGKDFSAYRDFFETIRRAVPRALDRAVREIKPRCAR